MIGDLADLVIARLRDGVPGLISVIGAVEAADLVKSGQRPQRLPAAIVLPIGDEADDGALLGETAWDQDLTQRIGVVVIHRDAGDATGHAARRKAVPVVKQVVDTLVGWEADHGFGPLHYQRARLHGLTSGAVWQQFDFAARTTLTHLLSEA